MFKTYLYTALIVSVSFSNEISVFGAGNLESNNPYGLTSAEKVIVNNKNTLAANKKALSQNQKRIKKVDASLNDLSQRIDGLESIFEGDGQKLNKVYKNFTKHIDTFNSSVEKNKLYQEKNKINIQEMQKSINQLKLDVDTNIENIRNLKASFDKIVKLVNNINSQYVTKAEFNRLLELIDKKVKVKETVKSETPKAKKSSIYSKPKKDILKKAKYYFKKDYFTNALPLLEYLIQENYRPAECNFYVGEIKYYRKKYKDALFFFKTSMMLYDKASYLPKLLLHSAISFEKTGQKDNAINFYTTLIEVYPESNEAKEASKKIK